MHIITVHALSSFTKKTKEVWVEAYKLLSYFMTDVARETDK